MTVGATLRKRPEEQKRHPVSLVKDPAVLEKTFAHLTAPALEKLEAEINGTSTHTTARAHTGQPAGGQRAVDGGGLGRC